MIIFGCWRQIFKVALNFVCCGCILLIVLVLLQILAIATFRIPTDSMQPTLQPGDNILVNKWTMGARIFDVWEVAEGKETEIHRLPGIGKVERGKGSYLKKEIEYKT